MSDDFHNPFDSRILRLLSERRHLFTVRVAVVVVDLRES